MKSLEQVLRELAEQWCGEAAGIGDYTTDPMPALILMLKTTADGSPILAAMSLQDFIEFIAILNLPEDSQYDPFEDDERRIAYVEMEV
ncbi:MAG: hypothetical protein OXD46_11770 [Chloroflexi bacterium]|nr:hypothetical protein [Chloroflexota bacterium]